MHLKTSISEMLCTTHFGSDVQGLSQMIDLCMKYTFTSDEDVQLPQFLDHLGRTNWKWIVARMGTRNTRQCRKHWQNYLDVESTGSM
jgi:hypothetical protein